MTPFFQILSPHILGGGHSSAEDAEQGIPHMHKHDEHQDSKDVAAKVQKTATGQGQNQGGHNHGPVATGGHAPHIYF